MLSAIKIFNKVPLWSSGQRHRRQVRGLRDGTDGGGSPHLTPLPAPPSPCCWDKETSYLEKKGKVGGGQG